MSPPAPHDGGRLGRALEALGCASPTGLTRLGRDASRALWNAFVDPRARHYMLLPADAWPEAAAPVIERPLARTLDEAGTWVVFWGREAACMVPAGELDASLDEILQTGDEGVIAINTATLDAILSVGGHGDIRLTRRPAAGRADDANAALSSRTHTAVIRSFVARGRAPSVREMAGALAAAPADVEAALHALHADHGLVLHPGRTEIWIAHPFSASPTATWVEAEPGRGWWAPCMWCALGVAVLAAPNAVIHTRLGAETREARITLRDGALVTDDLVVHFAIPARDAWTNVVHWCASVQPFADASEVAPWCARHGLPQGAIVPVRQVLELARAWYGGHLREDWRKWTLDEARAIFARVGLSGDVWAMPSGDRSF